jgi:hypothetical protein
MKKYLGLALIVLEYPLVVLSHKIDPSNLAGAGLDLWVLLLSVFYNSLMIVIGFRNWRKGIFPKLYLITSIASIIVLYCWFTHV